MNYAKKIIVITICAILAFPNPIWAKNEDISCIAGSVYRNKEDVMPQSFMPFEEIVKQELEKRNAIENFKNLYENIKQPIEYDENGRINHTQDLP